LGPNITLRQTFRQLGPNKTLTEFNPATFSFNDGQCNPIKWNLDKSNPKGPAKKVSIIQKFELGNFIFKGH
jgi:hypothetical protein